MTKTLAERFADALWKDPIIQARLAVLLEQHLGERKPITHFRAARRAQKATKKRATRRTDKRR